MNEQLIEILKSEEMQAAAVDFLEAKALYELTYQTITGYQKQILQELQGRDVRTGEILTDPRKAYRLEKDKLDVYQKRCDQEAAKHGFKTEPGICPLCLAHSLQDKAKEALVMLIIHKIPIFAGCDFKPGQLYQFARDPKTDAYIYHPDGMHVFVIDHMLDLALPLIVLSIRINSEYPYKPANRYQTCTGLLIKQAIFRSCRGGVLGRIC